MAFVNFAVSNVATAPSPATSGTSLTVTTGHGSRFPSSGSFNVTVCPADTLPTPANAEICTATRSGDVLTITRAQEGTTARAIVVGDVVYQSVTAADLNTPTLPDLGNPSAPQADHVRLFNRSIANREMLAFVGPSGLDTAVQPFMARNKVGYWNPPGNATTVPGVFGITAPTVVGTATARNVATTNILTRMRRLGYVSAGTAGSIAEWRVAAAQFSAGDGAGLGGFFYTMRFAVSDAATVSGARMFVGMRNSTAAGTNVEQDTVTNQIGVGVMSTDATQWYVMYGGSAAQAEIAVGTAIGAPTLTNTAWELSIFAPPAVANTFHLLLVNLGSGVTYSTTLSGAATVVPQSSTLLAPRVFRTNNATAAAVAFDVCSAYIETDY